MNPIESVAPNLCPSLQPVHHKHDPRPPEVGVAGSCGGFAAMLAQQVAETAIEPAEPTIEEPAEPTIELKPRKARTPSSATQPRNKPIWGAVTVNNIPRRGH